MILGIVQARVSSSRLPAKVLLPIMGRPMLELQLERIMRCRLIDRLMVATSIQPDDQSIEDICSAIEIECFRGDLNNVLDRFYRAASTIKPDHVVRLTGDCPLADPALIDELIAFYLANDWDYASNCLEPTLPDGMDAEIFSFAVLERAWKEAELPSHLEHVTPYIISQPNKFKLGSWRYRNDLSYLRCTVDEPEDFEFVSRVFEALYPVKPRFSLTDVQTLMKRHPELASLNYQFSRNEGFQKSLNKDREFTTASDGTRRK